MVFIVGVGGIIGAILRYSVGLLFANSHPGAFPLGTFAANLIGSFLLAWLTATAARSPKLPKWIVTGVGTGIIGSFTTFSTFSVETVKLIQGHFFFMAFIYILLSLLGGWAFSFLGYQSGRRRGLQ
ncbi:fluoride efflux transporter CrcB [Pullulanibacillus sp. KACC 23026]|uniref:fluoride efflux transporter CrcB n=1 Tax=Pullulanibacillus sp. KACC 23026 TaxID=3028315 RepID=UPI0023B07D7D|nr:fluoride efflux transporter CrcB [Pullulanibacillus sp. KACC 23026]WEG14896.1 fluoride efflux transporter CrcB [Pullulanibacillus sp. KACC 23026]